MPYLQVVLLHLLLFFYPLARPPRHYHHPHLASGWPVLLCKYWSGVFLSRLHLRFFALLLIFQVLQGNMALSDCSYHRMA